MSEFVDYYSILAIPTTATQKEIRNSYYRLVKIHHPDQGGNAKSFQKITEAYECLNNPEKRMEYDASLTLNSNKEETQTDIITFRNQHQQFIEENSTELTQEEIDNIYNSSFTQIQTEKFTEDDIKNNINNIHKLDIEQISTDGIFGNVNKY